MKRTALLLTALGWFLFFDSPAPGQDLLLDPPEHDAMAETFHYALEHNRTNEAAAWVNPDTGRSGTLVPVSTFRNGAGHPCREYVTTILIGGEPQQGYGTACRQSDGSWLIVSGEASAAPSTVIEKHHIVYPYGYRDWYDRYPYYVWDPFFPRIFFSFDIVHFSGHRHSRVHHFHGTKFSHGTRVHGTKIVTRPKHFHHDRFQGDKKFRRDVRGRDGRDGRHFGTRVEAGGHIHRDGSGRSFVVRDDRKFSGGRHFRSGADRQQRGEFRRDGGRGHGGRDSGGRHGNSGSRGGGHGSGGRR